MKVFYDSKARALYVEFYPIPVQGIHHTEEIIIDEVMLDINHEGKPCGIEVLGVESVEECPLVEI